ncbi:MAG TPA: sortase [Candidatus Limiplasma sp.]|nr:sortase [Candidatus Limiplasma sp.]
MMSNRLKKARRKHRLKILGFSFVMIGLILCATPLILKAIYYQTASATTNAVSEALEVPDTLAYQSVSYSQMEVADSYDYSAEELDSAQRSPGLLGDLGELGEDLTGQSPDETEGLSDLDPIEGAIGKINGRTSYLMEIPAIHLKIAVLQSKSFDDMYWCMRRGAAMFPKAPGLDKIGNVCISAHRTGSKDFFHRINELEAGNTITLHTDTQGSFKYSVVSVKTIDSDDWSVTGQTIYPALTLLSCQEYQGVSHGRRIMVRAKLISRTELN